MALAQFILDHIEPLIDDWSDFARTIPAAQELDLEGLRDHAEEMLRAIAADMLRHQTAAQRLALSQGQAIRSSTSDTPAEQHATARRETGFSVLQMLAEFRALRATVTRHWVAGVTPSDAGAIDELIRFNEGLDQAFTQSLTRFVRGTDEERDLFLGVIAHDMRSPISASINAGRYLRRVEGLDPKASSAVEVLVHSGEQLRALANDVLEIGELRLQEGSTLNRSRVDLGVLCETVVAALKMTHGSVHFELEVEGDCGGDWDASRLERVITNLLENAIKHGERLAPVRIRVAGSSSAVELIVENRGEPIGPDRMGRVFEPRATWTKVPREGERTASFGLGLYVTREIVSSHGGTIEVRSTLEAGTSFTVRLPRVDPRASEPVPRGPRPASPG